MDTHNLDYTWEQLFGAVSSLASSTLPLRERLLNAVVSSLHKIFPSTTLENELPQEIAKNLSDMYDRLTTHGSFQETIEKMEDREVEQIIDSIISIFNAVAQGRSSNLWSSFPGEK